MTEKPSCMIKYGIFVSYLLRRVSGVGGGLLLPKCLISGLGAYVFQKIINGSYHEIYGVFFFN